MMNNEKKPETVLSLEAAYGGPSQEGFGSAVFYSSAGENGDLEEVAKKYYRSFVGDKWVEWGEETWMAPWRQVYSRKPGAEPDIVNELRAIDDHEASLSTAMILDVVADAAAARAALSAAYDAQNIVALQVYTIGDGEALSGILLAGKYEKGQVACLVFLLD